MNKMCRSAMIMGLAATVAVGFGCGKKSAEDTERDWHTTTETAQKYASKYPAAKPVIDDLTKQAQTDFDDAKKATGDAQASKMQVAVDRLGKPLDVFKNYETEVGKLDALLTDKEIMNSMSAGDFKPLESAGIAAKKKGCCLLMPNDKTCTDLQGTCPPPAPFANMGDLKAKVESAISDMQAAEKPLAAKKPAKAAPAGSAAPAAGSAKAAGSGSGK
jgi:hypothetical protein|nr:hypothetical protein [Kofleriaceae bacterium]